MKIKKIKISRIKKPKEKLRSLRIQGDFNEGTFEKLAKLETNSFNCKIGSGIFIVIIGFILAIAGFSEQLSFISLGTKIVGSAGIVIIAIGAIIIGNAKIKITFNK